MYIAKNPYIKCKLLYTFSMDKKQMIPDRKAGLPKSKGIREF